MRNAVLIFFTMVVVSGCAQVWVVSRNENYGVIGYRGFRNPDAAYQAVKDVARCSSGSMYIVKDELKSDVIAVPVYQAGRTYSATGFVGSQNIQLYGRESGQWTTAVTNNYWREATYSCY